MNIQMENVANSYVDVITALNKELNNAIYWANTYERSLSITNEKRRIYHVNLSKNF